MLTKLIKYDIRSTWRDFTGIFLAILLGVILVPMAMKNFSNELVQLTAGLVAFAIVIAVIAITIINLFKIYNTNVFSKEGYLTMTLPVKASQILASKLLVSSMWITLTGIVSIIGMIIFTLIITPMGLNQLWIGFRALAEQLDGMTVPTLILLALVIILSITKDVAKLFLACTVAHLKVMTKWRIPLGILTYFVLSWIESFIFQITGDILFRLSGRFEELALQLQSMAGSATPQEFLGLFNGALGIGIIYSLLLISGFSALTIWLLNRKLDLD